MATGVSKSELRDLGISDEDVERLYRDIQNFKQGFSGASAEKIIEYANEAMHGYGVESVYDERAWVNQYWQKTIAIYVNMGDTYDGTLLFDTEDNSFIVTSWGDWYEAWESEQDVDSEGHNVHVAPRIKRIHTEIEEVMGRLNYELDDDSEVDDDALAEGNESATVTYSDEDFEVEVTVTVRPRF